MYSTTVRAAMYEYDIMREGPSNNTTRAAFLSHVKDYLFSRTTLNTPPTTPIILQAMYAGNAVGNCLHNLQYLLCVFLNRTARVVEEAGHRAKARPEAKDTLQKKSRPTS